MLCFLFWGLIVCSRVGLGYLVVWVAPNDRLLLQLYWVQHCALSMMSHSQQAHGAFASIVSGKVACEAP